MGDGKPRTGNRKSETEGMEAEKLLPSTYKPCLFIARNVQVLAPYFTEAYRLQQSLPFREEKWCAAKSNN